MCGCVSACLVFASVLYVYVCMCGCGCIPVFHMV